VGTLRALRAAAIPARLVIPAASISRMIGNTLASRFAAAASRASAAKRGGLDNARIAQTRSTGLGGSQSGLGALGNHFALVLGNWSPHEEWRPAVGPDGTGFFIANPNGNFDVFSLPPSAATPKLVFSSNADEWDPAVSPDRRWLVFASKRSGCWALMLLDLIALEARVKWTPCVGPLGPAC
jgi:WD40-like Beta Propeller Repeat